mgnify:CR=1 FL=1
MTYTWIIINIGAITTVGQNWLQKRTVVLEEATDKDYKWGIAFDLIKDKVNLIDGFKVGDTVDVSLNFRTNYSEKTKAYYNSINAWSIKRVGASTTDVNTDDIMPF